MIKIHINQEVHLTGKIFKARVYKGEIFITRIGKEDQESITPHFVEFEEFSVLVNSLKPYVTDK